MADTEVGRSVPSANSTALFRAAAGLAALAAVVFVGVAINELQYASNHPYAYGPARVIAWGAGAGAVAAVAIALVALGLLKRA